jgi:hypothetical protein
MRVRSPGAQIALQQSCGASDDVRSSRQSGPDLAQTKFFAFSSIAEIPPPGRFGVPEGVQRKPCEDMIQYGPHLTGTAPCVGRAACGQRTALIEHQERLITELDRWGHDTGAAQSVLATLRDTQRIHEQDVERLQLALAEPLS